MKKLTLILTAAAAAVAFSAACGPVDDEPTTGDGDMGGESGDGDGDGDGDATGGMGGNGTGGSGPTCDSSEVVNSGGAGGAAPVCEAPTGPEEEIEIAGVYIDQFEAPVEITAEGFSFGGGLLAFSKVDNEENYAIARNPEDDDFNPCAWSVFVWYEEAGELFYCQAAFDAVSECAALAVELPDSDDLLTGCNGFEWSALSPE